MAVKINAGDVKRGDLLFVDPFEIQVKEQLRGRFKPPTEAQIIAMAKSLMERGQLQPVECRKIENHRLQLTLGFTRTAAVRLIRQGFTDEKGEFKQDKNFRLQAKIVDTNDDQAFVRNIVENAHRNQTSPIDDAHNQQRLREQYGMSDGEIADLYQYKGQGMITRLKKLLGLEDKYQELVHSGKMSVNAALDLLDVPSEKREEVITSALNEETGRVETAEIRTQVRDRILADSDEVVDNGVLTPATSPVAATAEGDFDSGTPAPVVTDTGSVTDTTVVTPPTGTNGKGKSPAKARTIREIRTFHDDVRQAEDVDPAVKDYCAVMIGFINGTKSDKQMLNGLYRLLDAQRTPTE